jgi:3-hydroxyacyl-[acyl-carrier-protein] dehydratase
VQKLKLNAEQIRELLPHRYPMLPVDRALESGELDVVAEKLVSANEPFLTGHFPDRPIMPGVLILEAVAQTAGVWVFWHQREEAGRGIALVAVRKARLRRPVVPGDIMRLSARLLHKRGSFFHFEGAASVQSETVAETEFTAAFVDWEDNG